MILSIPHNDQKLADQLGDLLKVLPKSHPKYSYLDALYHRMLSGDSGENNVAYHLKFWYENTDNVVIANNLELTYNGRSAQIDHLIAMNHCFLVLESKNLPDRVEIADGNWSQVVVKNGKEISRKGIYDPSEQNRRHIAVLEDIVKSFGIEPPRFVSVIVLTRPDIVIQGYHPNKSYYLLRVDRLRGFIDKGKDMIAAKVGSLPTELINRIVEFHKSAEADVYAKYDIDPKSLAAPKDRIKFDLKEKKYVCALCGSQMILTRQKGIPTWGCSGYPTCKNLVPAAVAVEVGKVEIDRQEANKGLLAIMFSASPPDLCPVCGSVLIWKENRKEKYQSCPNARVCGYYRRPD